MDPNDLLQGIFSRYPFLAVVGPLTGLLLQKVKEAGKLAGFGLLGVSLGVNVLVIAAYGWAEAWTAADWHKAPLAVLVSLAVSNLVGSTLQHATDSLKKPDGGGEG